MLCLPKEKGTQQQETLYCWSLLLLQGKTKVTSLIIADLWPTFAEIWVLKKKLLRMSSFHFFNSKVCNLILPLALSLSQGEVISLGITQCWLVLEYCRSILSRRGPPFACMLQKFGWFRWKGDFDNLIIDVFQCHLIIVDLFYMIIMRQLFGFRGNSEKGKSQFVHATGPHSFY